MTPTMTHADLAIYDHEIPYAAFSRTTGKTVAVDIETVPLPGFADEVGAALDWHKSRIATVTICCHETKTLATVRVKPGKVPQWLSAMMWNNSTKKILHHAGFDLGFMGHEWGEAGSIWRAENVRCTKVAAKLLGLPQTSLAPLIERYCGVRIPKGYALSDWTASEYTPAQRQYLAQDVLYLEPLYAALETELTRANLKPIYDAACLYLPTRSWLATQGFTEPDDVFRH